MATEKTYPLVSVVLLNYNGFEDTKACLESLAQLQYPQFQVIVVDNASHDGSVERLRELQRQEDFPCRFHLIESHGNLGYSGGNNLAVRYILQKNDELDQRETANHHEREAIELQKIKYVWLLNNDATVDPRALSALVDEAQVTGGLVGSLVLYPDKSYQQVGTQIQWQNGSTRGYSEQVIRDRMEIECLTGASMLVPVAVFKRIGLLEESYFLYFEDAEFCLRAGQKHIPKTLALHSRVYHHEGKTTGKHSLSTQYYFHRNRLKVLCQYASPWQKMMIRWYAGFRLIRSVVKSFLNPNPERKASLAVQRLAMKDFYQGVTGPCPHNLQMLQ